MASLYREQIDGGRYFLHDHQLYASSWALPCMQDLERRQGVSTVPVDQYQYGFTVPTGPDTGRPAKKPIGFMSNSFEILQEGDAMAGTENVADRKVAGSPRALAVQARLWQSIPENCVEPCSAA